MLISFLAFVARLAFFAAQPPKSIAHSWSITMGLPFVPLTVPTHIPLE
jgi:hypothetical protein